MVNEALLGYSLNLNAFGIPNPHASASSMQSVAREYDLELRSEEQIIQEQKDYDALVLNSDQQLVLDFVQSLVDNRADPRAPNVVFVDGPAGTGKTFLYRKVLHYVRATRRIALAVAFSGIAALLLPGGKTALILGFGCLYPFQLKVAVATSKPNPVLHVYCAMRP